MTSSGIEGLLLLLVCWAASRVLFAADATGHGHSAEQIAAVVAVSNHPTGA
ncbi:hypothetical protein H8A99_31590 [Bradyrhizobium sp. Arg68]|uniref:hypothetical protein n=1 Tax=Bradyrhizobium ivorense TaxID=2511166 RepID=UPI001E3BADE2|nr:hypothetical protein [Bradyrhizobium ivorense]MCC8940861.1 hypothetical protein [Bradyrhizobium ivorense]